MIFNTIEEYDNELNEIKSRLDDMEDSLEKYPERIWNKGNRDALQNLYDIISKDREDFIKKDKS